ncbi:MAG: methionine ABC transporter ATP-binding protein [Mycetocola sp.]
MTIVSLRDVRKDYPAPRRSAAPVAAIDGVDLDVNEGDIFGIIGYSGAGKSTLVRLINALEPVSSGSITVHGTDITQLSEKELRGVRSGIGMIFQQFNLFNAKTVRGNIDYPLLVAGVAKAERVARVAELLEFVGLADKGDNYPDQLSGGQKQRVGIARALATSPRILLADEATSALDPETTQDVLDLLRRVNRELGITIIVITHEMEVIQSLATRVAVMEKGRVVELGDTFDVFSNPHERATKRFVSTVVKGVPQGEELAVLAARHPGRIITVAIREGGLSQIEVFRAITAAGIGFELIYGGIHDIQGRTFGNLTLSLDGDTAAIARVVAELSARVTITEVN